jgi:ZIP family zinc transporter
VEVSYFSDVSSEKIALLGAIAGLTIFLGLPLGRLRHPALRLKVFLNALAIGILAFLFAEIFVHAIEPVEDALKEAANEGGSWSSFVGLASVALVGLGAGLMSLVYYDRWLAARGQRLPGIGPGAAVATELRGTSSLLATPGRRLAMLIAVGIGLHNFAEGLAIGSSAASGAISLAVLLVVGFGLHNATEGFGIVAPLTTDDERPSWAFLALLGLVGGGPTFVGTIIGQSWTSDALSVLFLGLAAGSLLFVIVQLLKVATRLGHSELMMWGLLGGLVLGAGTELVVAVAGL